MIIEYVDFVALTEYLKDKLTPSFSVGQVRMMTHEHIFGANKFSYDYVSRLGALTEIFNALLDMEIIKEAPNKFAGVYKFAFDS